MSLKPPLQDSVFEDDDSNLKSLKYYTLQDSYASYREAAKSDAFLFGDYDGYQAFDDLDKKG